MIQLQTLPPLALYVHIPWCVRKCPYCDFNSHEARGDMPQAAYVDALLRDLEQSLPLVWGRKIQTIFFGGGTPSLISGELLDRLMSGIRALLPLTYGAEVTLEANPGTVEADKFKAFRDAGVNRLSLGIQSFQDGYLQALGRIHDASEAQRAVEMAMNTFDNVNLDLMYALPNQPLEHAEQDIQTALSFSPNHLSAYHLTIEPNTAFHHRPPTLPDEDVSADMQIAVETLLSDAGYQHYETSAFSKPGKGCRHNLNYWQFGDYLGIGAGAHSKLSFADKVMRQSRFKHPATYIQAAETGAFIETERTLNRHDLAFEFMMNSLRLNEGFPVILFQERTGLPISIIENELREAEQRKLITRDIQRIQPTLLGQRFLNELLALFIKDEISPR